MWELTLQYHVLWLPDMKVRDLMFALLGFSLALVQLFSHWEWECVLNAIVSLEYVTF
jgi:hypothetical protein